MWGTWDRKKEWENRWHWHSHAQPYVLERSWALIITKSGPERQKFSICHMKNSKAFVSREPSQISCPPFEYTVPSLFLSLWSISHISFANWRGVDAGIRQVFCLLSAPKPKGNIVLFQQRCSTLLPQLLLLEPWFSYWHLPSRNLSACLFTSVHLANKLVPLHDIISNYNMSSVLSAN